MTILWKPAVDSAVQRRAFGVLSVVCWSLAGTGFAQPSGEQEIAPADVLVRVEAVRADLEALRILMGAAENEKPEMDVKGAAPREVYFQALTLFQKADRFCFEHTRERAVQPELPEGDLTPAHVADVVETALACVRHVKLKYGLETEGPPAARDDAAQPTDVFKSIVQANRQLNLMLDRRFAPSDVFQQVTRAVGYSSRLLETFPEATRIPDEPPYEGGMRPRDVYRRLLGCVERIRVIAGHSGLQMLELNIDEDRIRQAEPSDVYDIASLIVAELAYLHGKLPAARPPRTVHYAGRKFPSHVFQRAGILERQLVELESRVMANPHWLQREQADR